VLKGRFRTLVGQIQVNIIQIWETMSNYFSTRWRGALGKNRQISAGRPTPFFELRVIHWIAHLLVDAFNKS
jgi:hypothetical protein